MTIETFEKECLNILGEGFCVSISISSYYKDKMISVDIESNQIFSSAFPTYKECFEDILRSLKEYVSSRDGVE